MASSETLARFKAQDFANTAWAFATSSHGTGAESAGLRFAKSNL